MFATQSGECLGRNRVTGGQILRQRWTRILAIAVLTAAAGCSSEDETAKLSTFSGLYSSYLSSCADCHTAGSDVEKNQVPGFVMTSEAAAYESLMKLANVQRTNACANVRYVKARSPEESMLLAVLDADFNAGFPSATASDCFPLRHASALGGVAKTPSVDVLEGMKTWITEGALR